MTMATYLSNLFAFRSKTSKTYEAGMILLQWCIWISLSSVKGNHRQQSINPAREISRPLWRQSTIQSVMHETKKLWLPSFKFPGTVLWDPQSRWTSDFCRPSGQLPGLFDLSSSSIMMCFGVYCTCKLMCYVCCAWCHGAPCIPGQQQKGISHKLIHVHGKPKNNKNVSVDRLLTFQASSEVNISTALCLCPHLFILNATHPHFLNLSALHLQF